MPLSNIQQGCRAILKSVTGGRDLRGRLAALGLLPGVELEVLRNSGHGPFIVAVKGSRIVLGRRMAARIDVEGTELV